MAPTKLETLLSDLTAGDETAKIKALQWLGHEMDPGDGPRVLTEIRR
jgi:hypothetical protein